MEFRSWKLSLCRTNLRLVRMFGFTILALSAAIFLLSSLPVTLTVSAQTTTPAATISGTSGAVSWDFGPVVGGTMTNVGIQDQCPPGLCDNHDLMLVLPAPAATFYKTNTAKLTIQYIWTSTVATDLDIFAISPNAADHGPGSPDVASTGPGEEDLTVTDPIDGLWHIRSVASSSPLPTGAHAVVTLTMAPRPTVPPPPPPAPGAPAFVIYAAPPDCALLQSGPDCITLATGSTTANEHGAGEPSIGVDWKTGETFIQAGNHTLRVTFNDGVKPASALWEDRRSPFARETLDPILFTDGSQFGGPNRTFTSQLNGVTSELSFTDDDANNWFPTQGSGQPAGVDHQTVGGGPYAFPPLTRTSYPHAIYYCSQDVVTAFCSRSDDGGLTFGPGIPMYTFTTVSGVELPVAPGSCAGLHGHVRVSPDGTVYVPNETCKDANGVNHPGVAVSIDNGMSWTVRTVPDATSISPNTDPSVGVGAGNTIYFGYVNGDGRARITVSHDRGQHWSKSQDAGTPFGIQKADFAEVIAGDDDRAAFAFLGTPMGGDTQSADFLGEWHLYVALTWNGGRTWTTADVTPSDPVQRGCIWNGGGSNPCRNLLDFNDITVDRFGRVLVGYADGCTGTCVTDSTQNASIGPASAQDALATIARQVGGRGLFAAFDGTQFGTRSGDDEGGGKLCFGDAARGVTGGPDCDAGRRH